MDPWRKNHRAFPRQSHGDQAQFFGYQAGPGGYQNDASDQGRPPRMSTPAGDVFYSSAAYTHPIDPSLGVTSDYRYGEEVRSLQVEIDRLRQMLHSAESLRRSEDAESRRRHVHQVKQLRDENDGLRREVGALEHELCTRSDAHEQQLAGLREVIEGLRRSEGEHREQLAAMREQRESDEQAAADLAEQLRVQIAEQSDTIESLEDGIRRYDGCLNDWGRAHQSAVEQCEWQNTHLAQQRHRLGELQHEFDVFRSRSSQAFAMCEDEIETLEATIDLLRTDHETVELINAELDHRCDGLQSERDDLQRELNSAIDSAAREGQQARRTIESLAEQLRTSQVQLVTVSAEKRSLTESLAKLKSQSEEFDATLFAKDQEIQATQKVVDSLHHQLQQLRQEAAAQSNLHDQLRGTIRELSDETAGLQQRHDDASRRADEAESLLQEQDRQLRDIQTAARAAEANAIVSANEAEQQFVVEIQRLEEELDQARETIHRQEQETLREEEFAELRSQLESSKQIAESSAAENDRLQSELDDLARRQRDLENDLRTKIDQIAELQSDNSELLSECEARSNQITQLESENNERRSELAQYADRMAAEQQSIVQLQQQLNALEADRQEPAPEPPQPASTAEIEQQIRERVIKEHAAQIRQLEQNELRLRERHHQAQLAQQQAIDSLNAAANDLIAQREQLTRQLAASQDRVATLLVELERWSQYENPIDEVQRLSAELGRKTSEHARQRESLMRRIEQLQSDRHIERAA